MGQLQSLDYRHQQVVLLIVIIVLVSHSWHLESWHHVVTFVSAGPHRFGRDVEYLRYYFNSCRGIEPKIPDNRACDRKGSRRRRCSGSAGLRRPCGFRLLARS